ncbi:MAG: hypothetical protein AAGJ35_14990 [Myxococcota bacterium]
MPREWFIQYLHPYDAADILFGFYTADYILPHFGKALTHRFGLLLAKQQDHPIGHAVLLFFLHKHGWRPEQRWSSPPPLPFSTPLQGLFGENRKMSQMLDKIVPMTIPQRQKYLPKLQDLYRHNQSRYELCLQLRPSHIPILVQQGWRTFTEECLPQTHEAWQLGWQNHPHLAKELKKLLRWTTTRFSQWGTHARRTRKVAQYIIQTYQLHQELHGHLKLLQQQYAWL